MARSGEWERFVETGVGTYSRAGHAAEYYEKLFKLRPQVSVKGTFSSDGGVWQAEDWVPVRVTSTGFVWKSWTLVPVGQYSYMLDRPKQEA